MTVKLSCFGKKDIPIFSYEFYKDDIPVGTTRVVLKSQFKKEVTPAEIASWLMESCAGNVYCCRYEYNIESINRVRYSITTTAIYFEDMDDMLMFKLSFHEIIHEFTTKTNTFAPIDKIDVSKHIGKKKHG